MTNSLRVFHARHANRACAPIVEHRPCFYAGHCAKVTVPFSSEAITASDSGALRCPHQRAAALLLLFNDDAAASALRARLPHDVNEAQQRACPRARKSSRMSTVSCGPRNFLDSCTS